jgi:hypothetical protein
MRGIVKFGIVGTLVFLRLCVPRRATGYSMRFLAVAYRLVPKIGPFRSLRFSVPTPETERLFLESFINTRERFRQSLDALRASRLRLPNTDFDTGKPTVRVEYPLADGAGSK